MKKNKTIRRNLRKQEIGAEKILWSKLNKKQLDGHRFRRQFGIGDYIVDFYCPKLKLVIEIDGATHSEEKEIKYDKARQKFIERLGLIVKRYTNENIQKNLPEVLGDLYEVCCKLKNNPTQPSPSQGEGIERDPTQPSPSQGEGIERDPTQPSPSQGEGFAPSM